MPVFIRHRKCRSQAEADRGFANVEWNEVLLAVDEKYRLVLMLYYVDGYKTSEISQILEIPESTVRTRLARGRERLAQICGDTKKSRKDGQCEIRMMEKDKDGMKDHSDKEAYKMGKTELRKI